MIEFQNVFLRYGSGAAAVHDLSFTIPDGAFVAVIGANGAGKTTAAKLMRGLLKPTDGQVLIDGTATTALRTSELAKRIGFLFQNPDRQLCKPTVREELAFGLELLSVPGDEIQKRVDAVLEDFHFDPERSPFALSRGERQRLALASLIAVEPKTLILDEPTTGLDYRECMAVLGRVKALHEAGTTVVMVCHDMELVLDFAERVLVFSAGRLLLDGETRKVFRDTETLPKASVLPPQITRLSQRLADVLPPADTVEEMEAAIRERKGAKA